MHVLSISFYYNDEHAAINCVIFLVLQWCYSNVSNVIKSNNFLIMDHFGYHVHTLCNIVYLTNAWRFFRIVHSIAARGFFV